MEQNPSKSILCKKCLKKLLLTSGIVFILLMQNAIPLVAGPALKVSGSDAQQKVTVTGRVVDVNSDAMPMVNVLEKGTSNGVLTNADGTFSITVASQASVIVFSFVGYKSSEVTVGTQTVINITLQEATTGLDEVVVIGYGTAKRKDLTGSVSSISGDVMRDVPSGNITRTMQGRLAGVEMAQTSSKPGSEMQIRIRGTRSLNASNDPLLVVDGIPFAGSINDIDPNSVKSVDILKDASATAIYGSRGSNGVILITTNKGQFGQKAQVTYNGYFGYKKIFAPYPMMNGPEFVALRTYANKYTNGVDESNDVNTDWQGMFYKTGMVTSHNIGLAGGTDKGNYSFALGYLRDEAVIPEQNFNRYSLHGSIDQQIGKYFRFGFTTRDNYSVNNGANFGGLYSVLSTSAIANPYNTDGSLKRTVKMPLDENWVYTRKNMADLGDSWADKAIAYGSYNSMYGEVKVPGIEGLKYRMNLGLNFRMTNTGSYTGQGIFSVNPATVSTASIGNSLTTNWAIENLLSYDHIFAGKHQINLVAMYSAEKSHFNSSLISAKDIPSDDFQYFNLGRAEGEKTIDPAYQGYWERGLMSYMARAMYSYNDRYMITATIRSDGSSVLASGHKWHTYPAVSVGWNIANESFMKNISAINMLKLRVGVGQTSNQSVDPYSTLGLLSTRPYNFATSNVTGYYVSTAPNPLLGWEYSLTTNYGLDFSVLNNRLSGTVEYYQTKTKDLLLSVNLPITDGVGSYMANVGEMENKGLEISLSGTVLNNWNGLTWEVGVNFYTNNNKLTKLASGSVKDESNWWFKGHPINCIFDYKKIGLWQESDQYLTTYEPGGNAGMIKVKYTGDFNPDGSPTRKIGTADRQILDADPDFQGGFNTRLSYKGFDLSAVGVFKSGGILISTLYGSSGYLNLESGRRGNVKIDYWTPDNTNAKYPKPGGIIDGDNPKYGSTLGYFNASYLKIRTISLGYNVDRNKWVRNAGISRMRIYATVENPFVMFSPYKKESGMDPETNSLGNENQAVTTTYVKRLLTIGTNTPSTRNYLVGIDLSF